MSREFVSRNGPPALRFVYFPGRNHLRVIRRGLGEQPEAGVQLIAGDRFKLLADNCSVKFTGNFLEDGEFRIATEPALTPQETKAQEIQVGLPGGKVRTVNVAIKAPPLQNPPEMELCGGGPYWALADMWGWDLRTWIDKHADAKFNYMRVIVPSRCWLNGWPKSIFKRVDGFYDLSSLDYDYLLRLRADLWYARKRGVVVHIDLWDGHMMRFAEAWLRSEFCGYNNTLQFPLPKHYILCSGTPWRKVVDHALSGEIYEDYAYYDLLIEYRRLLLNAFKILVHYIPSGHIIGDGNELDTRSVSRELLRSIEYGVKAYGGQPLKDSGIDWVKNDAALMCNVDYICLHQTDVEDWGDGRSVLSWYDHVQDLLLRWPRVKVLLSTDGTGDGRIRIPIDERRARDEQRISPRGRPTYNELQQIMIRGRMVFGDRFGGFGDVKLLGLETEEGRRDADGLFKWWKNNS